MALNLDSLHLGRNGDQENGNFFDDAPPLGDSLSKLSPEAVVAELIDHAARITASDLFVSFNESAATVSVRHLGIIREVAQLPLELGFRCMAYIRAVAGIRHDERRKPQDGRWIRRQPGGRTIDLRLSVMPTIYGESMAIRILERNSTLRKLDALGLLAPQLSIVMGMLHTPSGLILVTGPTGAGKTTTLYACLQYLNDGRRKIHTIEDPVEYTLEGLEQSQVDELGGADMAQLLRSVLRQGPDVIMIGEVRDRATADIAVRAANSGQLVFATLHAPTAAAAAQSLVSLGVHPHFLSNSLLGVIGQRLARTLDPATRLALDLSDAPRTFEEVEQWLAPGQGSVVYAAAPGGSDEGYLGRTGVFEILALTPSVAVAIAESRPIAEVLQKALNDGMIDFRRAALLKVAQGLTSFDEVMRVVPAGDLLVLRTEDLDRPSSGADYGV